MAWIDATSMFTGDFSLSWDIDNGFSPALPTLTYTGPSSLYLKGRYTFTHSSDANVMSLIGYIFGLQDELRQIGLSSVTSGDSPPYSNSPTTEEFYIASNDIKSIKFSNCVKDGGSYGTFEITKIELYELFGTWVSYFDDTRFAPAWKDADTAYPPGYETSPGTKKPVFEDGVWKYTGGEDSYAAVLYSIGDWVATATTPVNPGAPNSYTSTFIRITDGGGSVYFEGAYKNADSQIIVLLNNIGDYSASHFNSDGELLLSFFLGGSDEHSNIISNIEFFEEITTCSLAWKDFIGCIETDD